MGRELFETVPRARAVFEETDAALGFALSKLCFEGPQAELQLTANTQPAILTVSVAVAEALRESGVRPHFAAGHSLGEYSALVIAGAVALADAVRLVRRRGEYMQEAVPSGEGAMAALLGGSLEAVENLCRDAARGEVCSPANLNSPGQIVIAGHTRAVQRAVESAAAYGVRRAVMLNVSAPFHCSLMRPAAERLGLDLDGVPISTPEIPVVRNLDASFYGTAEGVRDGLKRQVTSPVRWEESMRKLLAAGAHLMIEAGPGKVLSGLMRQIERSTECLNADNPASVAEVAERARRGGR